MTETGVPRQRPATGRGPRREDKTRGEALAQQNKALVRQAVEQIGNQGDLDVADVLVASTYINHGGLIPDLVCGPEAIKSAVALYRIAFPRLRITVEGVDALDDMVTVRWRARNNSAPATGAGAGARGAALQGTLRCRVVGGQIAESWMVWDSTGVLHRMGITLRAMGADAHPDEPGLCVPPRRDFSS